MENETVANVLAVLCPGQGSQRPGMLQPWIEAADGLELDGAGLVTQWSEQGGIDLLDLGCKADAETIRDTKYAQPLIVAASLLSWRCYHAATGKLPALAAGHSIGEVAALAVAGVIADGEAIHLAAIRGAAMAKAVADAPPTAMAAVVGGELDAVVQAIRDAGLTPANINSPGQVVAAGSSDQIAALKDNPPAGTRVMPLQVAGAFHTDTMASATKTVAAAISELHPAASSCPIVSNRDGQLVRDGAEALSRITTQITNPVRWDLCQETIASQVSSAIELAPAKVLTGLAKRTIRSVAVTALTPADVAKDDA